MIKLLAVLVLFGSANCFAYGVDSSDEGDAICYYMKNNDYKDTAYALSCISKARIEIDKLELARLKAQIKKEKDEEKSVLKKNVEAAKKAPEAETFTEPK